MSTEDHWKSSHYLKKTVCVLIETWGFSCVFLRHLWEERESWREASPGHGVEDAEPWVGKDWRCCEDTQDAEVVGIRSGTMRFQVMFRSQKRMSWRPRTLDRGSDHLAGASALALRDSVTSGGEGSSSLNTLWNSFLKTGGAARCVSDNRSNPWGSMGIHLLR